MPGPGSYDFSQKKISSDALSFSLKGRVKGVKPNENPGPGAYDQKTPTKILTFNIGMSGRSKSISPDVPGPGAYTYSNKNIGKEGPLFTLKSRINHNEVVRNDSPGPG